MPIHNVETVRDNLKEYERFNKKSKLHFCIECMKCNARVFQAEGNLPASKLFITFKVFGSRFARTLKQNLLGYPVGFGNENSSLLGDSKHEYCRTLHRCADK